jgi:hypothetical protein
MGIRAFVSVGTGVEEVEFATEVEMRRRGRRKVGWVIEGAFSIAMLLTLTCRGERRTDSFRARWRSTTRKRSTPLRWEGGEGESAEGVWESSRVRSSTPGVAAGGWREGIVAELGVVESTALLAIMSDFSTLITHVGCCFKCEFPWRHHLRLLHQITLISYC